MGEKSKTSGESGEKVVDEILELIGWQPLKNISLPCVKKSKHKLDKSQKGRSTHGIDFLVYYKCPLSQETQEIITISSKYIKRYPSNPTKQFKYFLKDVAESIECLKLNQEYGAVNVDRNIKQKTFSGLIFWLAYEEEPNKGIIELIDDFRNAGKINFEIAYLVDNKRANFLIDSINFAKTAYVNPTIEFLYHDTGHNIGPYARITSGKYLPVQLINSGVLPLKIKNSDGEMLQLSLIDNFDENNLKRMISLSQNLTLGWGNKVVICFPDYHELKHKIKVDQIKSIYSDIEFTNKVSVKSYKTNFKSFEEE